ncbi:MAG: hypothetical protein ACLUGJ_14580 [Blautia wexlerae]
MRYLTVALTKGRLANKTMEMFEKAGINQRFRSLCTELRNIQSGPVPVRIMVEIMLDTIYIGRNCFRILCIHRIRDDEIHRCFIRIEIPIRPLIL